MSLRVNWPLLPTFVASVALATGSLSASQPASAQTPPPAPPGAAPSAAPGGDPPARVGWLSDLSGSVSFHSANQDQWVTATQNYPVASGDAVWTQPQAAASVMVDSTRLALNGGTELTAQEIDQSTITATLSQGEVFLDIVALQQGQSVAIGTPRGTAQIASNGEYEIYAGDSGTPTYVTTVTGSLQFTGLGANSPQSVGPQQTLVVQGTNPVQAQLGAMQQDQFLTSMSQQIAPPPPPSTTQAPAAVAQMTGAAVLTSYGTWQPQPSVGTVWFPQVASTWVPYRDGRWVYVEPWGWTWVDNAPWGFAPFHYGRWAQFGGRWGWVPQPVADPGYGYGGDYQPVYAPALVTFLGVAAGAFTAAAFASGAIGWAPLGIHDPYYPPYPVSPRYFGSYNRAYVPNYNTFYRNNVSIVNNRVSYRSGGRPGEEGFDRAGATFAPREALLGSRPIGEIGRPLPPGAQVQPFRPGGNAGARGLPRPTAGTWGVTPAFAQRERLAAAPPGAAPRPAAQGPAIRPVSAGAVGRRPEAPALVPHAAVPPSFRAGAPASRLQAEPGRTAPVTSVRSDVARTATAPGATVRTPEPRAETPRAEAPRSAEATHLAAPRAVAPRVEAPRPAAPRVEAPRVEAPRVEAPRVEAPRVEAPRPAAPRIEAPRVQAPRIEAPRMAAPRVEAPRVEARPAPPRGGAPRGEVRPPQK
jgi:hypothetical protein